MDRRDFLRSLPVVSAGTACGGLALGSTACGGFRYVVAQEEADRLVISRTAFGQWPDVLVESSRTPKPVYLRELESGSYSAVLVRCTHRGCQPEPEGDRLVCPCHGSEFAFTGQVLNGPAERPLIRFEVTEEDGHISIWLDRRIGG